MIINNTPVAYILVGLPASGKTTWVSNQEWAAKCAYISTDQYIEEYAIQCDTTYNAVFKSYIQIATQRANCAVTHAIDYDDNIIWDQTNLTIKSRRAKFQLLTGYKMIAVVFKELSDSVLHERLNSRPGKNIPADVIQQMKDRYEIPTEAEGFDEVWYVS